MKNVVVYGLIAAGAVLGSIAQAADCRIFTQRDRQGASFDANAVPAGQDQGVDGVAQLPEGVSGKIMSIWVRKGYALQTFRDTDFRGLAWTDTFIPADDNPLYIPIDGGYLNNNEYNSLEVRSLRCFRAPTAAKHVAMGGQFGAIGYPLDFYNDAKFGFGSGGREWSGGLTLVVTSVDGHQKLAITQALTRYTRTNGGPSVPPTQSQITYSLDLDTGTITVSDEGGHFPGTTILPVGSDNTSAFAYDAAVTHIVDLLDNYVRESSAKAQVRQYRDMLRSLQRVPYLGSKFFHE